MSKNHYRILIACILLCIISFSAFWWKELQKTNNLPSKTPYHIEVILKSYLQPPTFWSLVGDGILAAEKEFGITCKISAPLTEEDIDQQIKLVEQAIAKKPDAILLAAGDYERLSNVCAQADAAGILLLTIDSDVNYAGKSAFVGTDNVEIGRKLARLMNEQIGDKAKFGIISHVEGTATATDRLAGFVSITPSAETRMAGFAYCNSSESKSRELALEMLRDNPDIRCMVGFNESSALGIARAINDLNLQGKVALIACDSSEKQVQYLENGIIQACVVQNPFSMGYLSVANAVQLLNGQSVPLITYTESVIVRKADLNKAKYQQLIIPFTQY